MNANDLRAQNNAGKNPIVIKKLNLVRNQLKNANVGDGFIKIIDITPEMFKIHLIKYLTDRNFTFKICPNDSTPKKSSMIVRWDQEILNNESPDDIDANKLREKAINQHNKIIDESITKYKSLIDKLHNLGKTRFRIDYDFIEEAEEYFLSRGFEIITEKGNVRYLSWE